MSIDSRYKIPADATANVHSVSAIGEQYLDLVSTGNPGQYLSDGQNVGNSSKNTVPSEVGPALDAANRGLAVLPKEKIDQLLTETSQAVGGLGPALQRLVDSTTNIAQGFKDNLPQVNDIIAHSAPILDSQVDSGDNIEQWSRNLNIIAAQSAEQDAALRSGLQQAAPTLDQVTAVFSDVRDALAADAGQPGGRHRHAQALPQGPGADVGDLPAGRVDRRRRPRCSTTWVSCRWRCRSTSHRRA